jgi:hypothetical protein
MVIQIGIGSRNLDTGGLKEASLGNIHIMYGGSKRQI